MMMPWLTLLAAITISTGGQALLKTGAGADTVLRQILSWPTLLGLTLYGAAAILYIIALRRIPMSVALPCTALSYVAALLIGHYGFAEPLALRQFAAIVLISAGVMVLALA